MKKILITGATGLVGRELVEQCLEQGIQVHYLTTSKSKLNAIKNCKGYYWNPSQNKIDINCFKGVDVIMHLAGATISKRWTKAYKKEIIQSRVMVTQFLFESLKNQTHKVKQIIGASAIGIYPNSLTHYYDEKSTEVSTSFLGQVVTQWETAIDTFSELNIKVAKIRVGLVLSQKGGALPKMSQPVKFGLGAVFGSGNQWQSWIHIQDLVRLFLFVDQNSLDGIYNGVAPNAVTNKELIKGIAKALHRPLLLPGIPKWAMKQLLGEMHILLFESQRVGSKKIENLGFNFKYHLLQPALQDLF